MDPQLITFIIAIGGGITSVLALVAGRRQRTAEALANEGSAAREISEGYMNLVDRLEKRVGLLEQENKELKKCVTDLEADREADRIVMLQQIAERDAMIAKLNTKIHKLEQGLTNGHAPS